MITTAKEEEEKIFFYHVQKLKRCILFPLMRERKCCFSGAGGA